MEAAPDIPGRERDVAAAFRLERGAGGDGGTDPGLERALVQRQLQGRSPRQADTCADPAAGLQHQIVPAARKHGLFRLGAWGTEVHPRLAPEAGDWDIVKHRVSPFYGTVLEPSLRAQGIGRLYLCGVSTNGVVHSAVRDGHDRDHDCVVIEGCCAGISDDEHRDALACMKRYARIVTADAVTFEDEF